MHPGVKLQVLDVQAMDYIHIHLKQRNQEVFVLLISLPTSQLNEEGNKEPV